MGQKEVAAVLTREHRTQTPRIFPQSLVGTQMLLQEQGLAVLPQSV